MLAGFLLQHHKTVHHHNSLKDNLSRITIFIVLRHRSTNHPFKQPPQATRSEAVPLWLGMKCPRLHLRAPTLSMSLCTLYANSLFTLCLRSFPADADAFLPSYTPQYLLHPPHSSSSSHQPPRVGHTHSTPPIPPFSTQFSIETNFSSTYSASPPLVSQNTVVPTGPSNFPTPLPLHPVASSSETPHTTSAPTLSYPSHPYRSMQSTYQPWTDPNETQFYDQEEEKPCICMSPLEEGTCPHHEDVSEQQAINILLDHPLGDPTMFRYYRYIFNDPRRHMDTTPSRSLSLEKQVC